MLIFGGGGGGSMICARGGLEGREYFHYLGGEGASFIFCVCLRVWPKVVCKVRVCTHFVCACALIISGGGGGSMN